VTRANRGLGADHSHPGPTWVDTRTDERLTRAPERARARRPPSRRSRKRCPRRGGRVPAGTGSANHQDASRAGVVRRDRRGRDEMSVTSSRTSAPSPRTMRQPRTRPRAGSRQSLDSLKRRAGRVLPCASARGRACETLEEVRTGIRLTRVEHPDSIEALRSSKLAAP